LIVVDAGVLVAALAESGGRGALARQRLLRADSLHAPHLVDIEVVSALRGLCRSGKLPVAGAVGAIRDLTRLPVRRHAHDATLPRVWQLRENLTAYDAAYIALAETLDLPLVTSDARIALAPGVKCTVELLED
jgi:predicted nucleic acid-binding protein